ncbi:MAG: hypothetical protein ABJN75_19995, partial [Hoeflea sp.]|uniref:hypothetical protein n=1 Tax=Hoeflea sp. TaxID=1940281 RepID=UPI00329A4A7F
MKPGKTWESFKHGQYISASRIMEPERAAATIKRPVTVASSFGLLQFCLERVPCRRRRHLQIADIDA